MQFNFQYKYFMVKDFLIILKTQMKFEKRF